MELTFVLGTVGNMNSSDTVRMLSVACGSAEAVIETVKIYKDRGVRIEVTLLDIDQSALSYAEEKAKEYGVLDQLTFIRSSAKNIEKRIKGKFDVVEMLGFLDYQSQSKAVKLIERLRNLLVPGGYFLTCNIMKNPEMFFLRWVISWPMLYRDEEEIGSIMHSAGFSKQKISLVAEPLEIHCLATCQNDE